MKLSWSLNIQKGTISNIKESWPQMNKVDPYSTIDHNHKNYKVDLCLSKMSYKI